MIRSELYHSQHPYRAYFWWALLYAVVLGAASLAFLKFASSVHTYTTPAGTISLHVPYSKYLAGETINFTVKNGFTSAVSIENNCPNEPLTVYRFENTHWKRIHSQAKEGGCSLKARHTTIEPGKSVSGSYKNWPDLFQQPGKYRLALKVDYFDTVSYQDFTVIKKPKKQVKTIHVAAPTAIQPSSPAPQQSGTSSSSSGGSSGSGSTTYKTKVVSITGGSISVKYSATTVYVLSISPNSGCSYEGGGSGSQVEVQFKCGGTETQVQMYVSGGQLVTKVEQDD
ncbi:hypothetical protein KBD87_00530 [Candidatus Saccharibacteria bacterium]|nr:hypothetical protein [Candidatus Saccharibacteria bacterium]